jgi:DNA-binding MarR family transcriptional regulator
MTSGERERLLQELENEFRASQNATDMVDQAVADLMGVNRTDARCLDIIDRLGTVTAGRLAEESGLTTGAVTAVIDRLEGAGYVRRVPDEHDRRRVLVEITPRAQKAGHRLYEPLARQWAEISKDISIEQLGFLLEFTRRGREMNLALAADLRKKLAAREAAASRRERGRASA